MTAYELIVEKGEVIDGSGQPRFRADVGIKGERIAAVGDLSKAEAKKRINASCLFVCPGFIDMHTHSDVSLLLEPRAESMIRQGCTTQVVGNCGHSPAPARPEIREQLRKTIPFIDVGLEWRWTGFGEYLSEFEKRGVAVNVVALIGHCAVRAEGIGFENRLASAEEIKKMQRIVAQAMKEGAFGISSGLIYPLSMYADLTELVELSRVVGKYGGIYATHIRGEAHTLIDSVTEAIEIGRRSGAAVQISHHKAAGRENWGKVQQSLAMIEDTAQEIDIAFDVYPYTAGSANLSQLIPGWAHEGGGDALLSRLRDPSLRERIKEGIEKGDPTTPAFFQRTWQDIYVSYVASEKNKSLEGKSVAEIAEITRKEPGDVVIDLVAEENNRVNMVSFVMCQEDVDTVIRHPLATVGSDGLAISPYGPLGAGRPHPRYYGTFPRVLGEYVRERKVLTWEEAVSKMTGKPAQRLGLKDRGFIKEGLAADIVVFNPNTVIDRASFDNPHQYPEGIDYVIVNGCVEVEKGKHRASLKGKVLRRE